MFRTDYVTNSNDTYWLANPNAPLTGIPLVQGDRIENERTLRTRSGLSMAQQRSDGLGGNTFDLDSLPLRMLSNENYARQILRDDLVTLCTSNPSVTLATDDNGPDRAVDISAACDALRCAYGICIPTSRVPAHTCFGNSCVPRTLLSTAPT